MEGNDLGILPSLTKGYILSKITQEQIFEYYLGIRVEEGVFYKSPSVIRNGDRNPSFSFKRSVNGKWRGKDWAGYFQGDCFDAVAHILRLNVSDKKSFNLILDRIARDFRIHKYSGKLDIETGNTINTSDPVFKSKNKTLITFQDRPWDKNIDGKFWLAGNINSKLLERGRVYPCYYIWVNNNLVYNYNPKDPAYAYLFTHSDIKIYFPNRKEYRFLSNTNYLQGIDLLEVDKFGLITKSYKDVLSLKSYGIQAVAPSSETVPISLIEWQKIRYYCDHWFSLMDFDRTGILMAQKLRNMYNIRPLFFSSFKPLIKPKGKYIGRALSKNYYTQIGIKDFYDARSILGNDATIELINKTKVQYEDMVSNYEKEQYNDLSWIYNSKYRETCYMKS